MSDSTDLCNQTLRFLLEVLTYIYRYYHDGRYSLRREPSHHRRHLSIKPTAHQRTANPTRPPRFLPTWGRMRRQVHHKSSSAELYLRGRPLRTMANVFQSRIPTDPSGPGRAANVQPQRLQRRERHPTRFIPAGKKILLMMSLGT